MEYTQEEIEINCYQFTKEELLGYVKAFKGDIKTAVAFLFEDVEPDEHPLLCVSFVASGLYELEHFKIEDWIQAWMTYYIYRYLRGDFKGMIPDEELLIKDIKKISSMMTLGFKDLLIYDPKDGIDQSLISDL